MCLLQAVDLSSFRMAVDPCVGHGGLVRVLEGQLPALRVVTNDVNTRLAAHAHQSMFTSHFWQQLDLECRQLIVCSPPFSCLDLALAFVEAFMQDVACLHVAEELLISTLARREWVRARYDDGRLCLVRNLPLGMLRRPCCWLCLSRVPGRWHQLVCHRHHGLTMLPVLPASKHRGGELH